MSEKEILQEDSRLFNLIAMFASSVWCQLGKIPNPVNAKLERDLKAAQDTIDILLMLADKTKGNLTKKEEEMLMSTISTLQINYADEIAKPEPKDDKKIEASL
jgi:hypothetical protein